MKSQNKLWEDISSPEKDRSKRNSGTIVIHSKLFTQEKLYKYLGWQEKEHLQTENDNMFQLEKRKEEFWHKLKNHQEKDEGAGCAGSMTIKRTHNPK